MSSKTRTSLFETSSKASPATPRVSRPRMAKSEADSPSQLQSSRLSVDRSPRSVNSKPTVNRRSTKVTTPPEASQARLAKGTELQAQLSLAQEDLKKAKEQISLIEKEKAQAIDELKQAQKVAEEATKKYQQALVAQKQAEENFEIDKFKAVDLEQAGIEVVQKKEEEWQRELEAVRNEHALDVAALLSTTQELQRVKQELAMVTDTKNQALSHADDATRIAEIHADKVVILSAELTRLKALLDSKLETDANENKKLVSKLKNEIDSLKKELEKVKGLDDKLMETEASVEQLNVELEAAKMAESYARNVVEEWKGRVDELEMQVEEANKLERSASVSLSLAMRQLEGSNELLHDSETEISGLKEKVRLLEMTIGRQKRDLQESEHCLAMAKEEKLEMSKEAESLKSQLNKLKEDTTQALNNEKLAVSSVQSLLQEKTKLTKELESFRDDEEKSKKAMESLASALHEVTAEASEAREKLISSQVELENFETQIGNLRVTLKEANERYETMLDDSKHEIILLRNTGEELKNEFQNSKVKWEQTEQNLVNCVKRSEEENSSLGKEVDRLVNLIKKTEEEACGMREEEAQLKDSLKVLESEVTCLQGAIGETKIENMKLKESLLDKENQLQSILQENEELQIREASSRKKLEEMSKLLEEAVAKKQSEDNGDLTDGEKQYDLLPKMVEFSHENRHLLEEKPIQSPLMQLEEARKNSQKQITSSHDGVAQVDAAKMENVNGKPKQDENKEEVEDSVEVEFKMLESCKIEKKEFSPAREPEQESFEQEEDSKVEDCKNLDQTNGLSSTENVDDGRSSSSKEQQHKKKKPLLGKFGKLLKKKGASNQK